MRVITLSYQPLVVDSVIFRQAASDSLAQQRNTADTLPASAAPTFLNQCR